MVVPDAEEEWRPRGCSHRKLSPMLKKLPASQRATKVEASWLIACQVMLGGGERDRRLILFREALSDRPLRARSRGGRHQPRQERRRGTSGPPRHAALSLPFGAPSGERLEDPGPGQPPELASVSTRDARRPRRSSSLLIGGTVAAWRRAKRGATLRPFHGSGSKGGALPALPATEPGEPSCGGARLVPRDRFSGVGLLSTGVRAAHGWRGRPRPLIDGQPRGSSPAKPRRGGAGAHPLAGGRDRLCRGVRRGGVGAPEISPPLAGGASGRP